MKHETREQWLNAAVLLMTPMFKKKDYEVPKVRVSCGWPDKRGTSAKNRTIGQCWSQEASSDGVNEIFISPWLDNPDQILGTLVHEVVHAVVGIKEKHNKVFAKCARAMGLAGKLTATVSGPELLEIQKSWATTLDKYPHAKLDLLMSPIKKQGTRMIKMECMKCGYVARTSQKWLTEVGAAHCPKHGEMHYDPPADDGGEDEEEED
jgi:hypothetical protein